MAAQVAAMLATPGSGTLILHTIVCLCRYRMYTVGAIIISSLADFVGLPTYEEWNCENIMHL